MTAFVSSSAVMSTLKRSVEVDANTVTRDS